MKLGTKHSAESSQLQSPGFAKELKSHFFSSFPVISLSLSFFTNFSFHFCCILLSSCLFLYFQIIFHFLYAFSLFACISYFLLFSFSFSFYLFLVQIFSFTSRLFSFLLFPLSLTFSTFCKLYSIIHTTICVFFHFYFFLFLFVPSCFIRSYFRPEW